MDQLAMDNEDFEEEDIEEKDLIDELEDEELKKAMKSCLTKVEKSFLLQQ